MRGSKARLIRRIIYGTENSPRARSYGVNKAVTSQSAREGINGETVIADDRRRMYQQSKRAA